LNPRGHCLFTVFDDHHGALTSQYLCNAEAYAAAAKTDAKKAADEIITGGSADSPLD
jgi:hypothetical protein